MTASWIKSSAIAAALASQLIAGQAGAATAYARVSVTVLPPVTSTASIQVAERAVDLSDTRSTAITVMNPGSATKGVSIAMEGTAGKCDIRFSPAASTIPPGRSQVVRVLNLSHGQECDSGRWLAVREEGKLTDAIRLPILADAR